MIYWFAASDLALGGTSFPFNLTSGYTGFDKPSTFLQFNKGLNARVEAYRGTTQTYFHF
jgi:hypothetical protein